MSLNLIDKSKPKLSKNSVLLVPLEREYTEASSVRPLQLKDLSEHSLEDRMMMLPNFPMFLLYYCTSAADVLGRLVVSQTELIFEPLNHAFRGFYDYQGRNEPHAEGDKPGHQHLGTVVSYEDIILEESRKVSINKPQQEECYVRVSLAQTGN